MTTPAVPVSYPFECWPRFSLRLTRLYEGNPMEGEGVFSGPLLILWHILEGSVVMRNGGQNVRGGLGDWLVCLPGTHYHRFSESARLLSLQFIVECPGTAISWRGPEVLKLSVDPRLEEEARLLGESLRECGFPPHFAADAEGPRLPLPGLARMHAAMFGLFGVLLECLAREGVWLEAWHGGDPRARRSLELISALGLEKPFSRDELARACGVSASQLDRIWLRELGVTPRQYRNRLRLNRACEWLRNDSRSIKEIATALGFDHQSHFCAWFQQACKMSPTAWRQSSVAS